MAQDVQYSQPIVLYHHNSNIRTIAEFYAREHIYKQNGVTVEQFFETNRTNILNAMTGNQRYEYAQAHGLKNLPTDSDLTIDMELPCPCNFVIDGSKVNKTLAISATNLIAPYDDVDELIRVKTSDLSYAHWLEDKIVAPYQNQNEQRRQNALYKIRPSCTTFGWFKSAMFLADNNGTPGNPDNVRQAFFELSPFVISQSTSQSKNGGSWRITLPFIPINPEDGGMLKKVLRQLQELGKKELEEEEERGVSSALLDALTFSWGDRREYVMKSVNTYEDDAEQTTGNFFEWLMNTNDVLFMAFDSLAKGSASPNVDNYAPGSSIRAQAERQMQVTNKVGMSQDRLNFGAERSYDMIGLIDSVRTIMDPETGNTYVEVSGRDLMKLLLEDGSFFYNISATTQQADTVFANNNRGGKQGDVLDAGTALTGYTADPASRLRWIGGEIDIFKTFINLDIPFILKGVISKLANIEVVPSAVFTSWGNRRTKFVDLMPEPKDANDADK